MSASIMCYGEKVNIEGPAKLLRKFRIEPWKLWKLCLEAKKEKGFEKESSKMEQYFYSVILFWFHLLTFPLKHEFQTKLSK